MNVRTQKHTFHVRSLYEWEIHNIFRYFNMSRIVGVEKNIWT